MHWGAVGTGLLAAGGIWLAVQAAARRRAEGAARTVEGDPVAPPEPAAPGPPRAWPHFVGPLLALAVGLGLLVAGRG